MSKIGIHELLKGGVHLGHKIDKYDRRTTGYLLGNRNDLNIIDLEETVFGLRRVIGVVREVGMNRGTILFIGSDRGGNMSRITAIGAKRCSQYYINNRWIGGLLTNWKEVVGSIDKLRVLESSEVKKNSSEAREYNRLRSCFGGVKNMECPPDIIFLMDLNRHKTVIREANRLNIPIIGVVDSNSDPSGVSYVIPGNDDSLESVYLFCDLISKAVLEGMNKERIEFGRMVLNVGK